MIIWSMLAFLHLQLVQALKRLGCLQGSQALLNALGQPSHPFSMVNDLKDRGL